MEGPSQTHDCPLCKSNEAALMSVEFKGRRFYNCQNCALIFVDNKYLPDLDTEKNRYLLHLNTEEDQGYVKFLSKLTIPLLKYLPSNATGLDFGCGPNPVLSAILEKSGIRCLNYDPFFFPELPTGSFDFVTATECFEHFHFPQRELAGILEMIQVNGILAIMTDTWQDINSFGQWHYIRDITHVSFYHLDTMEWIAKMYGLELIYSDHQRVFIFRKLGSNGNFN